MAQTQFADVRDFMAEDALTAWAAKQWKDKVTVRNLSFQLERFVAQNGRLATVADVDSAIERIDRRYAQRSERKELEAWSVDESWGGSDLPCQQDMHGKLHATNPPTTPMKHFLVVERDGQLTRLVHEGGREAGKPIVAGSFMKDVDVETGKPIPVHTCEGCRKHLQQVARARGVKAPTFYTFEGVMRSIAYLESLQEADAVADAAEETRQKAQIERNRQLEAEALAEADALLERTKRAFGSPSRDQAGMARRAARRNAR